MGSYLSDPSPLNMGVLQGSILGPLLIRFLNYIPSILETCETDKLADDTELDNAEKLGVSHILEANLNNDLN